MEHWCGCRNCGFFNFVINQGCMSKGQPEERLM